jgi:hypothetical protein
MDKYILYDILNDKITSVEEEQVLDKIYFLEMCVPTEKHIKNFLELQSKDEIYKILKLGDMSTNIKLIKEAISKIEYKIPLYDIYSENIYLIGKYNVYDRVVHYSYRFPSQLLLEELLVQEQELEKTINKLNPLEIRKINKIKLMLEFMDQFDLTILYETYMKVFYKYSQFVGLETTICKKNSFISRYSHLTPYYTRNEIINMALNLGIKTDKYIEYEDLEKLCKKIKINDITHEILLQHQKYIIDNNVTGLVQYYTLQGSYFMNQYLRKLNDYVYINKYLEDLISPMWNLVINAPPFDNNYTFYRFIHDDSYLSHLKIGDIYTEPGFMSTTRDPFYRADLYKFGFILLKIKVPKNVKGVAMCLELISHFPEEQEIIFSPNSKFKLLKKDEKISYFHTDEAFSSKIKTKYEFEFIKNTQPIFTRKTEYIEVIPIIDFLNIKKIETFSLDENIKYFMDKYVNPLYQFKTLIGDMEITCLVERYDSSSSYKKFYALEIKNGMSIYTMYKGYILFFLEIGEIEQIRQMHVNYYVKYSTLDTRKIMGDNNFIQFISSIAYYFDIPTVIIYANYLSCNNNSSNNIGNQEITNNKPIQQGGLAQRGYIKEEQDNKTKKIYNKNIYKIDKTNLDKNNLKHEHYGGSYCIDLFQYFTLGLKRYETDNIINIEINPKFSYYELDILKTTNVETILVKNDRDECYQVYDKIYKLEELKPNISDYYIWLQKNKCYLLDTFITKISRFLGVNNPFLNDWYILDPATFLYNRKLITNYPTFQHLNINPKRNIFENKNNYRL